MILFACLSVPALKEEQEMLAPVLTIALQMYRYETQPKTKEIERRFLKNRLVFFFALFVDMKDNGRGGA